MHKEVKCPRSVPRGSHKARENGWEICNIQGVIELYVESLKERRNCGFDSSFKKFPIGRLLARRVLEPTLKVG